MNTDEVAAELSQPGAQQLLYPPITIGGNGPKRTLRAAARWGSEWNATVTEPTRFAELREVLRGHCADLGRDFSEITCSCLQRWDGGETGPLLAALAEWRDAGADLAVIGLPLHAKPESLAPLADVLRALA